ncbi:MAG: uroporphyrinogen decarboxylase family protein [bacterium]
MNSRERVRLALDHQEADHVPLDLGGTGLTLIHLTAYKNLRKHLNLPVREPTISYMAEQLAAVEEDLAERLETDVALVMPQPQSGFEFEFRDEGAYEAYADEWGIGWRKPKEGGFYYDMYLHPLSHAENLEDFKTFKFPDPLDDHRFQNLRRDAERAVEQGKAVALAGPCSGILEMVAWTRGLEQFYVDLAINHQFVTYMLDRLVEFKCAFWRRALAEVGDLVDVAIEADDMAGQRSLLFSPETYRKIVKSRHEQLFSYIKRQAPVKLFFHSCGAIRPLIGDLIEAGIDILNPVQISAAGMDPEELKGEFGPDLVFWGGGVDTQSVLGGGTPEEVKEDVRRNIEALAPGGGFVFATVHDIQANVPPQNIMAMWEAWKAYGVYSWRPRANNTQRGHYLSANQA